jgi:uncharacterized membrane protein
MRAAPLHNIALGAYLALILLTLAWEGWLAPTPPAAFWLIVKALPLLAPLFGLLHGKTYTYAWSSMLIIAYFIDGMVVAVSHRQDALTLHAPLPYGILEVALSLTFLVTAVLYVRVRGRERRTIDPTHSS